MKLNDLKAKVYDLLGARQNVEAQLQEMNKLVNECCKKCNENACVCKKGDIDGSKK